MINKHIVIKNTALFFIFMCLNLYSQASNKFIENKGQENEKVIATLKIPGGSVFLEKNKFLYSFFNQKQIKDQHDLLLKYDKIDAHCIKAEFVKSNENVSIQLKNKSSYYHNYYYRKKFIDNVRLYDSVIYKNLYQGIDMRMYHSNELKYDFIISPNIQVNKIKIKYSGQNSIKLKNGNVIIETSVNTITELQPYSYQIINDVIQEVKSEFKLNNNILSFYFPEGYDRTKKLIIDPSLIFSTYSGSTADNFGYTATFDKNGFLYSAGTVFGTGYPITTGAYQINYMNNSGGTDIGITKYDTSGTYRIYSTYLGGSMDELPHSMIVNHLGELFIFGTTGSKDFPITSSAYDLTFNGGNGFSPSGLGVSFPNGSDIFICRISADGGSLLASTYIGGSGNDGLNIATKLRKNYADEVRGEIDIDNNNNIYLATSTYSSDFPTTNSFQSNNSGGQEGCILKMDNQLSTIIWSSYLGGTKDDAIYSLSIDDSNNVFLVGGTNSDDFPVTSNSYQSLYQDSIKADAFICHVSNNGNLIINSSYYGSNQYDQAYFVELNSKNQICIFGQTNAPASELIYNANYYQIGSSQFVAILNYDLDSLIKSTKIGTSKGSPDISPTAFLVDVCNNIYLSGWGSNTGNGSLSTINLPISNNAYQNTTDGNDFYVMVLDKNLDSLIYATYFGGSQSAEHVDGGTSRFDEKGVIYQSVCAGCGNNDDFPIVPNPGAVSATNNSNNCNNGVFKFDFNLPILLADFECPEISCEKEINFNNLTDFNNPTDFLWDFGDGNISNLENPIHQYQAGGEYLITLIANSRNSCNFSDTITKTIYIINDISINLAEKSICKSESIQIGIPPINDTSISYLWTPSNGISNTMISNPYTSTNSTITYNLIIYNNRCSDTLSQIINVDSIEIMLADDSSFCKDPIQLFLQTNGFVNSYHWSTNSVFSDTISDTNYYIANSIGIYYIKVKNNNCQVIDSIIIFNDNILTSLSGTEEICIGDSAYIKINDLSPLNPITSLTWESEYDMTFNEDSSCIISYPDSSTYYKVIVTNSLGCVKNDSIKVGVRQYPIYDSIWASKYVIMQGEITNLYVSSNDSFFWEFNIQSNPLIVSPDTSTTYLITIYNESCLINDSITIYVNQYLCDLSNIIIPTAFSPNKDGVNDYYKISDNDNIISNMKFEIYNRFGEKVYSSNNINDKWNGEFKQELLSMQVLNYYLKIDCHNQSTIFKKGNITLIR
ncbi:MAG: hypothetical protein CMP51_01985 [Flavobacteriales bacterium]|nr:hypothetical protein [Flavobacteriales bacterium]